MLAEVFKQECLRREKRFEPTRDSQAAITLAAQWLDDTCKQGLLIGGKIGCGKTTLLEAIRRVINGALATVGNGLTKVEWRAARDIATLSVEKPETYAEILDAPILAIDDLGEEDALPSRFGSAKNPIANLILHRYEKRLCTLATTNLDSEARAKRYGDRAEDRVAQMFRKLVFPGESMRKRLSQIDPWQAAARESWEDELDRMESDTETMTFEEFLARNPGIADVVAAVPRPDIANSPVSAYDASKAIHEAAARGNADCLRLIRQSDRHFQLRRMRWAKEESLRAAETAARLKEKNSNEG